MHEGTEKIGNDHDPLVILEPGQNFLSPGAMATAPAATAHSGTRLSGSLPTVYEVHKDLVLTLKSYLFKRQIEPFKSPAKVVHSR